MRFIWLPKNTAHVRRHVPTTLAERVMLAEDLDARLVDEMTYEGTGTVDGELYRIWFMTAPGEVYIITCYRARRGGSAKP